jgi:RNA polymerase sigma-70 factor, ECF subfamily
MKIAFFSKHSSVAPVEAALPLTPLVTQIDMAAFRAEHLDFVWLVLQRFGVTGADLEDATQEVFMVVHRRIGEFDGGAKITTWLYAIAQRVALATRRKKSSRREVGDEALHDTATGTESDPEHSASQREARVALEAILDTMDPDKRAVFVMFEIEELECETIAELIGVPIGTVHSRLHHARKDFERAVIRYRARNNLGSGGNTR